MADSPSPSSISSVTLCSWPPCTRTVTNTRHDTCSILHFNFSMSMQLDPPSSLLPHNKTSAICALPGCYEKVHPGHDFCTKTHALNFLSHYLRELRQHNRLCKMPGCMRHVFVESNSDLTATPRIHEFCGWNHAKGYLAYKEISVQEHSLEFRIGALKRWALERKETRGVEVDENFFSKHPWEILTQPDCCSKHVIAKCKFKRNSETDRDMTTIDGMHWKQQGRKAEATENITVDDCKVSKRYLTYSRLRSSSKRHSQAETEPTGTSRKRRFPNVQIVGRENQGYTIIEYKIVDDHRDQVFKHWCLLKVSTTQPADQRRVKTKVVDESAHQGDIDPSAEAGQLYNGGDEEWMDERNANLNADERADFFWPPDNDDEDLLDDPGLSFLWPEINQPFE